MLDIFLLSRWNQIINVTEYIHQHVSLKQITITGHLDGYCVSAIFVPLLGIIFIMICSINIFHDRVLGLIHRVYMGVLGESTHGSGLQQTKTQATCDVQQNSRFASIDIKWKGWWKME